MKKISECLSRNFSLAGIGFFKFRKISKFKFFFLLSLPSKEGGGWRMNAVEERELQNSA